MFAAVAMMNFSLGLDLQGVTYTFAHVFSFAPGPLH